jgi:tetratricopeptide (TPR) repeat protein
MANRGRKAPATAAPGRRAAKTVKTAKTAAPSRAAEARPAAAPDPLVQRYEQGLRAMHGGKWAEAARVFREVAAAPDEPELAGRARQQLSACEQRTGKHADAQAAAGQAEPFLLAVFEKNRGAYDVALQICARGGRQSRDERFAYLAASIHALRGDRDDAVRFLSHAIALNPKNRVHAFHDPDFASLRAGGEIADLLRA